MLKPALAGAMRFGAYRMAELSVFEIFPLVLALAATGAVAGILSGLLGVGGGIVVVPLSILCAPLGTRRAHALNPIWIKRAFAVFLSLTAVCMLSSAV